MTARIKITLTEFMNFVNKSGSAKATVVKTAKSRRENENSPYSPANDYWYYLRKQIVEFHKKNKKVEFLDEILKSISQDKNKRSNYKLLIDGYKSFIGKKQKFEYILPIKKTWIIGNINIALNPELILSDKRSVLYVIKLFLSAKDSMDRKHADLILTLLEHEMRGKVGGLEPIFAVLDVRKHKLFKQKNTDLSLYPLLKGEALSFETQWKALV